jgi:hypothetical protein
MPVMACGGASPLTRLFDSAPRIFQSFSHGSFRCLRSVFQRAAGRLRSMFNGLPGFGRSLFHGISGFLNRVLIVGSRSETNENR